MKRRDRWLSMSEVAKLVEPELVTTNRAEARRRVWRLIRRLEARDGTRYLRRFGSARNSPLHVSVAALEQLMPWDPGTLTAMREQMNGLGMRVKRVERRVGHNETNIKKIADWTKRFAGMVGELPALIQPK